jgi:hypothetical protein
VICPASRVALVVGQRSIRGTEFLKGRKPMKTALRAASFVALASFIAGLTGCDHSGSFSSQASLLLLGADRWSCRGRALRAWTRRFLWTLTT